MDILFQLQCVKYPPSSDYSSPISHPGVLCNVGYLSETHLKLKSHEILFAHNLLLRYAIVLKFGTEHSSDTAVFCTKFQNNWKTGTDVMDEQVLTRFEFKMRLGLIWAYCTRP